MCVEEGISLLYFRSLESALMSEVNHLHLDLFYIP